MGMESQSSKIEKYSQETHGNRIFLWASVFVLPIYMIHTHNNHIFSNALYEIDYKTTNFVYTLHDTRKKKYLYTYKKTLVCVKLIRECADAKISK